MQVGLLAKRAATVARLALALLFCAMGLVAGAPMAWGTELAGRTPVPSIAPAKPGSECVAPPAQMRREHPDMLKHQRDETVHGGIRGAKASLKACVACHASVQTQSVALASGDFCISCHSYAAVKVDCFECHASQPKAAMGALHASPGHGRQSALALRMRAQVAKGLPP